MNDPAQAETPIGAAGSGKSTLLRFFPPDFKWRGYRQEMVVTVQIAL